MSKQTAVEWLIQNIKEDQTVKAKSMSEWVKTFNQAKAMEKEQLDIPVVNGSSIELVEQRCKSVLKYLFGPNYEREMTAKQYNNAMEALRSIAFGTPKGKNYR